MPARGHQRGLSQLSCPTLGMPGLTARHRGGNPLQPSSQPICLRKQVNFRSMAAVQKVLLPCCVLPYCEPLCQHLHDGVPDMQPNTLYLFQLSGVEQINTIVSNSTSTQEQIDMTVCQLPCCCLRCAHLSCPRIQRFRLSCVAHNASTVLPLLTCHH